MMDKVMARQQRSKDSRECGYEPYDTRSATGFRRPPPKPGCVADYFAAVLSAPGGFELAEAEFTELLSPDGDFFRLNEFQALVDLCETKHEVVLVCVSCNDMESEEYPEGGRHGAATRLANKVQSYGWRHVENGPYCRNCAHQALVDREKARKPVTAVERPTLKATWVTREVQSGKMDIKDEDGNALCEMCKTRLSSGGLVLRTYQPNKGIWCHHCQGWRRPRLIFPTSTTFWPNGFDVIFEDVPPAK